MNIYKYKNYLILQFWNISYFKDNCILSGHYTSIIKDNKFIIFKHGDYESLTSYKQLTLKQNVINKSEIKFFNDLIFRELNSSLNMLIEINKDDIYFKYVKKAYKIKENWIIYFNKRISNIIQYGDELKDIKEDRNFIVNNNYDLHYLNDNKHEYKILNR